MLVCMDGPSINCPYGLELCASTKSTMLLDFLTGHSWTEVQIHISLVPMLLVSSALSCEGCSTDLNSCVERKVLPDERLSALTMKEKIRRRIIIAAEAKSSTT